MGQFTATQCQAVAKQYRQLSSAAFRRRLFFLRQNMKLSDPTLIRLQDQQFTLGNISNEYAVKAAALTLEAAEQAAAKISDSLDRANTAMIRLHEIDRAITIASDAIDLAVAVYSGNFDQIAGAAKSLVDASASQ